MAEIKGPKLEEVKKMTKQSQLDSAFEKSAKEYSKKAVDDYKKSNDRYDSGVADQKDVGTGDILPAITMLKGLPYGIGNIANSLSSLVNQVTLALSPVDQTIRGLQGILIDDASKFFLEIKKEFGNIEKLTEESANQTVRNIQKSRQNIDEIYVMSAKELREAGLDEYIVDIQLPGGVIEQMNMFQAGFENIGEAYDKFIYAATQDEQLGTLLANQMVGLERETLRLTEGLGFTSEQSMTFIKRQMNLTGQAGTDMLEELSVFSVAVEKATGVSFKKIAKGAEKIMSNVEVFGSVTSEQAAKISGALLKAGLSFEKFSGLMGNLQNFDSATTMMGDLAAGFGINIDAMDLMVKAYEDPEAAMYDLKDAFEDAGLSIEDMGQAQKQLLSSNFGMGIEEIERFFGDGFLPDQEALDAAAEQADPEEAIETLRKGIVTLINEGKNAKDVAAKAIEEIVKIPLANQAFDLSRELAGIGATYRNQVIAANKLISGGIDSMVFGEEGTIQAIINKATQEGKSVAAALNSYFGPGGQFANTFEGTMIASLRKYNEEFGVQNLITQDMADEDDTGRTDKFIGLTSEQAETIATIGEIVGSDEKKDTATEFEQTAGNIKKSVTDMVNSGTPLHVALLALANEVKALVAAIKDSDALSSADKSAAQNIALRIDMDGTPIYEGMYAYNESASVSDERRFVKTGAT